MMPFRVAEEDELQFSDGPRPSRFASGFLSALTDRQGAAHNPVPHAKEVSCVGGVANEQICSCVHGAPVPHAKEVSCAGGVANEQIRSCVHGAPVPHAKEVSCAGGVANEQICSCVHGAPVPHAKEVSCAVGVANEQICSCVHGAPVPHAKEVSCAGGVANEQICSCVHGAPVPHAKEVSCAGGVANEQICSCVHGAPVPHVKKVSCVGGAANDEVRSCFPERSAIGFASWPVYCAGVLVGHEDTPPDLLYSGVPKPSRYAMPVAMAKHEYLQPYTSLPEGCTPLERERLRAKCDRLTNAFRFGSHSEKMFALNQVTFFEFCDWINNNPNPEALEMSAADLGRFLQRFYC